jgi:hypothetical protein
MKALMSLLVALSVSSQIGYAPTGYHYNPGSSTPTPNDPCQASFVNTPGVLSGINSTIGKPKGVRQTVVSVSGSADVDLEDVTALGLPGAGSDQQAIACYATVHYQDGSAQDGIFDMADPGNSQPLRVVWVDRATVENARTSYEQQRRQDLKQTIAFNAYMQACVNEWRIGIEAKSFLGSGRSEEATAEFLINEHAYGPDGQPYDGSDDAETMIRQVVGAVAMTPDLRRENHVPDYANQQFLNECPTRARQAIQSGQR